MARREIITYNPILKERARFLRRNMTPGEVRLWKELKQGKLDGYDFDRQRPIGEYIVDFYCKELRLAIEIDGQSHDFKQRKDAGRQELLEELGVRFLRFWEHEVRENCVGVVERIREWIKMEETHPGPRTGHPSGPPSLGSYGGPREGIGRPKEFPSWEGLGVGSSDH